MANDKKRRERFTTPAGTALFPRLNTPDFKYKKENGEYSVKLKLTAEQAGPIIAKINEETEKAYKAYCVRENRAKLKRSPNIPYKNEVDDNEKETGNVIFSFKLPGKVKSGKTGEEFTLKPTLFNKAGERVEDEVWGGSTIQVSYEMRPYYTEGLGAGMTLRVVACRIVTLVTRGMGGTAESYGFEVEEADDTPEDTEPETTKPEASPGAKPNAASF